MTSLDSDGTTKSPEETPTEALGASEAGPTLGRYSLLQKIGEGGMGEVWLAQQHEPVRRRVALKIVKAGMDTQTVVARFEAERQALALMSHPGVAKVFDAGSTPRGLPFFAMEFVAGRPITVYCDARRLDPTARLQLVVRVCEAVQHAHQKGIIHRDLKPSNILVSDEDGMPAPKVIDFGVAKAIAQPLTEAALNTEFGVVVGTPEYMSPEQAELGAVDVDTRSDIYSLGVILYELLTGTLPLQVQKPERLPLQEIRRRIRDTDPERPSARISSLGKTAAGTARDRGTEPTRLASRLRGDLDWIVLKALEKEPSRRYGSPAELAADIERHLANQPVSARPPSAAYRAGKFARRHRTGVVAAAVVSVALIVAAIMSTIGLVRARRAEARSREEAETAEQVSSFLVGLFKESDPSTSRGNSVTAREVLDRGADEIARKLEDRPDVKARLEKTLGEVYISLGLYEKAVALLEQAVALNTSLRGEDDPGTLSVRNTLGAAMWYLGRYDEAEAIYKDNHERQKRILGPDHAETLSSIHNLALLRTRRGDFAEAERMNVEALEGRKRVLGAEAAATLASMNNLANLYSFQGRLEDSERLYRETLAVRKRVLGEDHPDTLATLNGLASTLFQEKRYEEAGRLFRNALETRRRVFGPDHPDVLEAMGNLAIALLNAGDSNGAIAMMRSAVAGKERVLGEDHVETLKSRTSLAGFLRSTGQLDEAETMAREALGRLRSTSGEGNPATLEAWTALAEIQLARGRKRDALESLRHAVAMGYLSAAELERADGFASLRESAEFEDILAKARANAAAARATAH